MHQWKTVNDFDLFMIHLIHKYLHKFSYNKIKDMEVKFIIYNMSVYIRLLISKNLNLADNFQSLQNRDIEENQRCSAWYETIMLASFKLIPLVSSLKFVRTIVHTKVCVCVCMCVELAIKRNGIFRFNLVKGNCVAIRVKSPHQSYLRFIHPPRSARTNWQAAKLSKLLCRAPLFELGWFNFRAADTRGQSQWRN